MKKKTILIILFIVIFSLCGCVNKEENKETTKIEEKVEVKDNYSVSGYLLDKEGNPIKNANLVIYSDTPHYVKTDDKGYFYSGGLEKGSHEIYYVENEINENLTKEEIKNNSIFKIDLSTENNNAKYSNEDYSLDKFNIENNIVNNTYNVTLNPNGGNLDKTTIEVTRNIVYYGELPIPIKEGYIFDGWYYNDELITENTIVKLNEEHTLIAKYHLDAEIITYNDGYDGKEHVFEVIPKSESVKVTYSLDNEKYTENKYTFKNVGEYTIYYKVSSNNEEKIYKDKLIITKSSKELKLSSDNGTTIYPNIVTLNVEKNELDGEVTVESSDIKKATVSISNNIITIKPISTGEVTITVKAKGDLNYNDSISKYKLVIKNGTFSVNHLGYDSSYDGNYHSISVNPNISDTTITYSLDNKTFTKEKPEYKDAGEYKVYYKVEKYGYETIKGYDTIKISKSNNTLSIDKTSGDITYPGSDVITVTTNSTLSVSSSDSDIATATVNNNQVMVNAGTKQGIATITISTESDDNHDGYTAIYTANVSNGIIDVTGIDYNGTYDGNEHTGEFILNTQGITIKYGTIEGIYDLNDIPKYINAGVYTIYYEVSKSGYITKVGYITVTINKADNILTLSESSGSILYPNTKTISIMSNVSGGSISVISSDTTLADASLDGDNITITSKLKEGTSTITVTSAETTNYNLSSVTYNATIVYPSYDVTFVTTNATVSTSTLSVKYAGSNSVTITPSSGYYLSSVSCTNGYTTNASTGIFNTSAQNVSISNNNNQNTSVCTINTATISTDSLYYKVSSQAVSDTVDFSIRSGATGQETNGVYTTTSTEGNVPVYYYRGNVDNHVIFNNMCWRIVRTTETGGVKLIYNGTPTDGTCVATGTDTMIGNVTYNTVDDDNAYVGYMYGSGFGTYTDNGRSDSTSTLEISSSSSYYYSTSYTFDTSTGVYSLSGTKKTGVWSSNYVNYYTCKSPFFFCTTLYYIAAYNSTTSATAYSYTRTFNGSTSYNQAHANTNSSTIKTYIDNWYSTNFTSSSVTSKIEDTVYCNDRSTVSYDAARISDHSSYTTLGYGANATLYGATNRASYDTITPSPTLVCSLDNDKFTVSSSNGNGELTYPVGLITLDEAVFAGFNTLASNTSDYEDSNNYLYVGSSYWTLSPVCFDDLGFVEIGNVIQYGRLSVDFARFNEGVRPVISLKAGVTVTGNGTSTSPYVVD